MPEKKKKTPQTIRASAETMGMFKKYAKGFKTQDEALMDLLKKAGCCDSDAPTSELPETELPAENDWNAELETTFLDFSAAICNTKQLVRDLFVKHLQIKNQQIMDIKKECDRLKTQNKNLQAKIKSKAQPEAATMEHMEKAPKNAKATPVNAAESSDSKKKEEFECWVMQADFILGLKKENEALKKEKELLQQEYAKEISMARREAALEVREEIVSQLWDRIPEKDDKVLGLKSDLVSAAVFE